MYKEIIIKKILCFSKKKKQTKNHSFPLMPTRLEDHGMMARVASGQRFSCHICCSYWSANCFPFFLCCDSTSKEEGLTSIATFCLCFHFLKFKANPIFYIWIYLCTFKIKKNVVHADSCSICHVKEYNPNQNTKGMLLGPRKSMTKIHVTTQETLSS